MGENKENIVTTEDIIKVSERLLNQKYLELHEEYWVNKMDEEKLKKFVEEREPSGVKPNIYATFFYYGRL